MSVTDVTDEFTASVFRVRPSSRSRWPGTTSPAPRTRTSRRRRSSTTSTCCWSDRTVRWCVHSCCPRPASSTATPARAASRRPVRSAHPTPAPTRVRGPRPLRPSTQPRHRPAQQPRAGRGGQPGPCIWRARVSVLNTDTTVRLPMPAPDDHQAYSLAGLSVRLVPTCRSPRPRAPTRPPPASSSSTRSTCTTTGRTTPSTPPCSTCCRWASPTSRPRRRAAARRLLRHADLLDRNRQGRPEQVVPDQGRGRPDLVSNAPAGPKTIFNTASVFLRDRGRRHH